jgi:hypothetical protein
MEPLTFRAAPVGACRLCIRQLAEGGMPAARHDMPDGRALWSFYCQHHECGAYALATDGTIDAWTMKTMPVEQWQTFAAQLPHTLAEGMRALAEQAAEQRGSLN